MIKLLSRPLCIKLIINSAITTGLILLPSLAFAEKQAGKSSQAIEIGTVDWLRDHNRALELSKIKKKPIFALFQEVPGCDACQTFGKVVLSNPLLVEAIESEFIPLVIFNNQSGEDAKLLKRYNEPSWNYQVIRFLGNQGEDLIPRKDKIWTIPQVAERMRLALKKSGKTVPNYLKSIEKSHISKDVSKILFTQHCFWTGEHRLGSIDGVLKTEAGFYGGHEVTKVWYNPSTINQEKLIETAKQLKIADEVYLDQHKKPFQQSINKSKYKTFDSAKYREAPNSDQKRQLKNTPLDNSLVKKSLNQYQLTKLNSFYRGNRTKALSFLSPKQRALINNI